MSDGVEKAGVSLENPKTGFELGPRVRADASGYLPPLVSYAQNFEDVILRRVLQDVCRGYYIDIGAWDPIQDSVTACFYENGWRGINIEPNPQYFAELELARTRDINLACVIGAANGTCLFTILEGTGLSSGIPGSIESSGYQGPATQRVITVPCVTLDQLLALAGENIVDFLKIDAEGMEADIINAASFAVRRPRIIIVEATWPLTQIPTHQDWEPHLLAKDYDFALFDGLNRFYVRREDAMRKAMFALPPCVFDNFLIPTIAARLQPLEAAVNLGAAERQEALTREAVATAQWQETIARVESLETTLAQLEGRERDLRQNEARLAEEVETAAIQIDSLEAALKRAAAENAGQLQEAAVRNESLEAALARSEEREREALNDNEAAATRIEALETALEQAHGEAAAWEEARNWKLDLKAARPLYRRMPFRFLHRQVVLRRARSAMRRRDWANAARDFRQTLAYKSELPYVWVEYGHALKESGSLVEAARAYRNVLLAIPDHPDIAQHLAFVTGIIGAPGAFTIPRHVSVARSSHRPRLSRPNRAHDLAGLALSERDPLRQRELICRDFRLASPANSD